MFTQPSAPVCAVRPRSTRTTGAPLLMIAAGQDDYTGTENTLRFARELSAGDAQVRLHVLEGAHHAWETQGTAGFYALAQNFLNCHFLIEDDGAWTDRLDGVRHQGSGIRRAVERRMGLGAHAGGGSPQLEAKTLALLEEFLRQERMV